MAAVGFVLICAGALKVGGIGTERSALLGPASDLLAAQFELLLGVWLVFGYLPQEACLVALATFLGFACWNLFQSFAGAPSCGCFGRLHVNPLYVFFLDLGALAALAYTFRRLRRHALPAKPNGQSPAIHQALIKIGAFAGCVVVVSGGIALIATAVYGSPRAALAQMRGERLTVEPVLVDIGIAAPNETRSAIVKVQNWHDQPIAVIGAGSDCACRLTDDLPLMIPAGKWRMVTVQFTFPPDARSFRRTVHFMSNDVDRPFLPFQISGVCVEPDDAAIGGK
jgi:hypothetical protein